MMDRKELDQLSDQVQKDIGEIQMLLGAPGAVLAAGPVFRLSRFAHLGVFGIYLLGTVWDALPEASRAAHRDRAQIDRLLGFYRTAAASGGPAMLDPPG